VSNTWAAALVTILSGHTAALLALAVVLGRTRENLARAEAQVEVLMRRNGQAAPPHGGSPPSR